MSNPYKEIFSVPGAKGFSAAGFFARLPIAMAPIGIVAMLSQTHGEYWLAGAVSATFALTNALVAPQISRLVDRFGQTRHHRADHDRLGDRLCPPDPVRQPELAGLDLVRLGLSCRRHAQHAGHAAGALDARSFATGRSSTPPLPLNPRPTSWSISPAPRSRSGWQCRCFRRPAC